MDVEQIKLVLPAYMSAMLFWEESIPHALEGFLQKQNIAPDINNKIFPPGRLEPFTMGKNLVSHFRSQPPVLLAENGLGLHYFRSILMASFICEEYHNQRMCHN